MSRKSAKSSLMDSVKSEPAELCQRQKGNGKERRVASASVKSRSGKWILSSLSYMNKRLLLAGGQHNVATVPFNVDCLLETVSSDCIYRITCNFCENSSACVVYCDWC